MRFYQNTSNDPYYNLALEEYVTQTATDEVFLLWRNAHTIVFGRNQNPADEMDIELAKEMGIHIVRRMSGGGAVYHDLGNINFSYISQKTENFGDYITFAKPIIEYLRTLGVEAQHIGNNDIGIEVTDRNDAGGAHFRKISGNAQYISKGNILHHGTLLFDTDLSVLSKVLTPDPSKLEGKGIASVRSRVANISEYCNLSRDEFWQGICGHFADCMPVEDIDFDAVMRLRNEKYATEEWVFGQSPNFVIGRE